MKSCLAVAVDCEASFSSIKFEFHSRVNGEFFQ